ncbi:MAG: hypothetical protein HXX11_11275 [Desulfuromonadales bacterium]|nr:hypothetical protein [Desulfuromonadales bacterium]
MKNVFPKHKQINLVNFAITSRCNRCCPHCSYGMHILHDPWDITWDELILAATTLGDVCRINLTGGEPSVHPQFAEWAPKLKQVFAPNLVSIETNGFGFKLFPEAFMHFDMIAPTIYDESFPGGQSNRDDIEFMITYRDQHKALLPIHCSKPTHLPRTIRTNGSYCFRAASGAISFFNNRLFPCCTGHGIEEASSVNLSPFWREDIMKCPLACRNCMFAVKRIFRTPDPKLFWQRLTGNDKNSNAR